MGEGERYEEFAPPDALRPFVRLLWTYAAPRPSGGVQRIAPDGCPELVVDLAAPYEEQDADGVFRLQPSVIFADEPTGALDQATGHEVMQILRATARMTGSTLVLVTHDRGIAARCDRRITIEAGRLVDNS